MSEPTRETTDGLKPVDLQALARIRSQAIKEFCANAGLPASVQAKGLPDDVRGFRLNAAIVQARDARANQLKDTSDE